MWKPDPSQIITAEQRQAEAEAAARLAAFPPLSPEQFHAMLNITGHRADVEAVLEAMSDPENGAYDPVFVGVARARLDYATHFNRDDPLLETMADMIGLTAEQVDDLWTAARNL